MGPKRVTIGFQEPSAAIPIPGRQLLSPHNHEGGGGGENEEGQSASTTTTSSQLPDAHGNHHRHTSSGVTSSTGSNADEADGRDRSTTGGSSNHALRSGVASFDSSSSFLDQTSSRRATGPHAVRQMSNSWESSQFVDPSLTQQQQQQQMQEQQEMQSRRPHTASRRPTDLSSGSISQLPFPATAHPHSVDHKEQLMTSPLFAGGGQHTINTHGHGYSTGPQSAMPLRHGANQPPFAGTGAMTTSTTQPPRRASIASTSLSATDLFQKSPKGRQFPSIHSHTAAVAQQQQQQQQQQQVAAQASLASGGVDGLGISYHHPSQYAHHHPHLLQGKHESMNTSAASLQSSTAAGPSHAQHQAASDAKKMTKAERRALQEQQKAAKMAAKAHHKVASAQGVAAAQAAANSAGGNAMSSGGGGNNNGGRRASTMGSRNAASGNSMAASLAGTNAKEGGGMNNNSNSSVSGTTGGSGKQRGGGSAGTSSGGGGGGGGGGHQAGSMGASGAAGHHSGASSLAGGGGGGRQHRLTGRTPSSQNQRGIQFFSHLQVAEEALRYSSGLRARLKSKDVVIHPAILSLALQYSRMHIIGSNARCLAMLQAFREVISDYTIPENQTLSRHLESYLKPQIDYLTKARALSVGMGSAIRHLKIRISRSEPNLPEDDAKKQIDQVIRKYIRERILISGSQIATYAASKIQHGDVILTFARSTTVERVLMHAHELGIKFKVIVIDAKPLCEGRCALERLASQGIHVTYAWINAIGVLIKDATKVFLGAGAVLNNGSLLARAGTAVIALAAHDARIPLMVCCETYKFTERLVLDSIVMNELADPLRSLHPMTPIRSAHPLQHLPALATLSQNTPATPLNAKDRGGNKQGKKEEPACLDMSGSAGDLFSHVMPEGRGEMACKATSLHLLYDVTPSAFITCIVTELGLIPTTSVPVVLRRSKDDVQ